MTKLMWLSDSPTTVTGFATISKNICNGLTRQDYECHFIAHNLFSQIIKPPLTFTDDTQILFNLHGCGREGYCKDIIVPKIQKYRPDVFGVLLDTFMLYPWYTELDYAPAKTIFYYPSDGGGGLPNFCDTILKKCDLPVAMSKFGQKQIKELHGIDSIYIPHAIDQTLYYPKNKEECKARFGLQGKFVVGSVYRNQGRKMADRMFKAFAVFCKDKPDAVLFLHSDPLDPAGVFHTGELIKRLNLENRVVFSGMRFNEGFDYRDMVNVYNAMDIFFLSTSGEGFGIPIIEAMACGIPVVATDYTTTPELIVEGGRCGEPVNLVGIEDVGMSEMLYERGWNMSQIDFALNNGTITGSWTVERGMMCINDAAKKMTKLYNDSNLCRQYGKVGREKVMAEYTWDLNIQRWNTAIKGLLK